MRLIFTSIKIQIKKIMAYPYEGLMLFIYSLFNIASIGFFWTMLFNITGGSKEEKTFIYLLIMMGMLSLGIGDIFFGLRDFEYLVQDGSLDKYLYRPSNMMTMILLENVPFVNMVQQIIIGTLGIVIVTRDYNVDIQGINALKSLALLVFGNIYYHLVYGTVTILSLWIEKVSTFRDIIFNFSIAKNYPLGIFPKTLQNFLTYIIPIALTTYYPTVVLIGGRVEKLPLIIISFIFFLLVFIKLFKVCIHKYSSNGG